ncbi:hypothetical protein CCP3SC1_450014 [Gammaproteobacteria bacterium]
MFEGDGAQWDMFVQQARELLLSSRADLRLLTQQSNTVGSQVLERLIRIFHSIGSLSNFFKLGQITAILERMEAILAIWKEQPSLLDSYSTTALDAAFWVLHQSFSMEISRGDNPVLQEQIGILQGVLDKISWKGANEYLGTAPPFDLHDYPDDVAVAVAEGRHMFALHFPLPKSEQQHQLNQLLEQLITVGELVTSVPRMSSDFELEDTTNAFSVWLLFSTHLQQELLMELTQLPTENLIPLPLPEMMRVAQVTAEAVEQPREKKFTELVLRTLQSHLEKTSPAPRIVQPAQEETGVSFEERKEEMELLALQISQSSFQETPFTRLKRTALGVTLSIGIVVLLVWIWNHLNIAKNDQVTTELAVEKTVTPASHVVKHEEPIQIASTSGINTLPITKPIVPSTSPEERNTPDHPPIPKDDRDSTGQNEITKEATIPAIASPAGQPEKVEQPSLQVNNQLANAPTTSIREESGHLTSISREAATLFTTIVPAPGTPQGSLRFTRNCNGSITFSIATLLNHTISRKGERLLISQEMFQNIKLFLQNTKDKRKALMFDFDETGQVTISPIAWRTFIKNGSGVMTVSHLFGHKDGTPMVRDITALVTGNLPEQLIDTRKGSSQKSCTE